MKQESGTTQSPNEPPRRRGCFRVLFRSGCGCGAFLVGALAVLVLLLPNLWGRALVDLLVDDVNGTLDGSLTVRAIDLSWFGEQRLDGLSLRDPDGALVAELDVLAPSLGDLIGALLDLALDERASFGRLHVALDLDLVTDPSGPSNLERALGAQIVIEADSSGEEGEPTRSGSRQADYAALLERIAGEAELRLRHFSWRDPRLDPGGAEFGLRDLSAKLSKAHGGPVRIEVVGEHHYQERGNIQLLAEAFEPRDGEHGLVFGRVEASGEVRDLPTLLIDRLAKTDGLLESALGAKVTLELASERTAEGGSRIDCSLRAARGEVDLALLLSDGRLRAQGEREGACRATWRVEDELLQRLLQDSLPEGARLELLARAVELELRLEEAGAPLSPTLELEELSAAFTLRCDSPLVYSGPGLREPLRLAGVTLDGHFEPGSPLDLALRLDLLDNPAARVGATARLRAGWPELLEGGDASDLRAECAVSLVDLPTAEVSWRLREAGLPELLGETVAGTITANLVGEDVEVLGVELRSGGQTLNLNGSIRGGALHCAGGEEGLLVRLSLPAALVADTTSGWFPPGTALRPRGEALALELHAPDLVVPLAATEELAGHGLTAALRVGPLVYRDAQLAAGGTELGFEETRLDVLARVGEPVELRLACPLAGESAGSVTGVLRTGLSLPSFIEVLETDDLPGDGELRASSFPTRLLDAWTEQDGLLVDVLGSRMDLVAQVARDGGVDAHMSSGLGEIAWQGQLVDGALVSSGEEGLAAKVGLSPLFSERIVGQLVPLLVGLAKPEDGTPVELSVSELRLPLAGDLSRLDADVRLDLGEVDYSVLPGLTTLWPEVTRGTRRTTIEPLLISIRGGVASYAELPLKIEGKRYLLNGEFDLSSGRLRFSSDVPLKTLGRKVSRELDRAREYLDPELTVPVVIGGTPRRPTLGLRSGFLEEIVGKAARGALEKELGRGLRKLFGDD